ncbi:MAG: phosphoadenylyl-sulfate reductase [Bacilli bacterium]
MDESMDEKALNKDSSWKTIAQEWEPISAQDILSWAVNTYGMGLTMACSFGAEDVVLLDMLVRNNPKASIFYLNTDLHFKETYETKDRLEAHYGISFIEVRPLLTLAEQSEQWGEQLWANDPNQCCHIRKVAPLAEHLKDVDAWITGIRRDQSLSRAYAKKVEWDALFNCVKVNPIVDWTSDQVWEYIRNENVPYNPLHDQNYPSIGCYPCTRQVMAGEDSRAGRWSGFQKTECGLHRDRE